MFILWVYLAADGNGLALYYRLEVNALQRLCGLWLYLYCMWTYCDLVIYRKIHFYALFTSDRCETDVVYASVGPYN